MVRENCSPQPDDPPARTASRPCRRCVPLPRPRFSSLSSPAWADEDVRGLWIFGFRITFALSTGNYKPRPRMPRNPPGTDSRWKRPSPARPRDAAASASPRSREKSDGSSSRTRLVRLVSATSSSSSRRTSRRPGSRRKSSASSSVRSASMVVSAAPLGIYSDRRGRKGLLLIGSAILPPSILVFAVTTDVRWMVLAALAAGVGEGAFLSSWNAIIADQTTVEQRNVAFALSFVLNNVFSGVGLALPFSFPFIQAQTGLSSQTVHVAALVLTDGLGFVMPVAFYFLLRDYRETIRTREARPKGMDWKPLLKFSGINGLIGLGAGFFIPLVPTWLFLKFAVPDTWSGPLLALSNVTIGLAATVSASLAKRYGPVRAIVMAQGLSTVFMFSLAFVTNAVAAAGLYMVRAALMNMSAPIGDSFLMGIVAPEQRGLASAVNSIVWRLPNSVTTILGGILMAGGYYDIPIFLATAFYVASIASFYVVFHHVRPSG